MRMGRESLPFRPETIPAPVPSAIFARERMRRVAARFEISGLLVQWLHPRRVR